MEDLSLIYEDVDIKIWADEIRHIKIRELRAIINMKRNLLKIREFISINDKKRNLLNDIERLTDKLKIIEEQ